MPQITWIDAEGQAISREIGDTHFEVWTQHGSVNLEKYGRQPAYRVPFGGTLILEVGPVDALPPINWRLLGLEALVRGEHKQLSDKEIDEVNRLLEIAYGRFTASPKCMIPITRELALTRLDALFTCARERYQAHVAEAGNAGAPEEGL